MKRALILCLLIFMILPAGLFAYEHIGGGRLDLGMQGPDINGTIAEFTNTDRFTLWYEGAFNEMVKLNLEAALVYEGAFGAAANIEQELEYLGLEGDFYPDIRSAHVFGVWNILDYRVGRHVYTDPSEMIISHPVDGFDVGAILGPGFLRVELGYTGLINYLASDIAMTKSDLIDRSGTPFGAPRLLESVFYTYPEVLGEYMTLTGGILAQQDLLDDSDVADYSEKLNTVYFLASIEGFILPTLAYDTTFIYQVGSYDKYSANGFLADAALHYFPGAGRNFLSFEALVSSGEEWDSDKGVNYYGGDKDRGQFIPISGVGSKGYVHPVELGNLTALELLLNLSWSKKFAIEASTMTMMRTVDGPVSSTLIVNNGESGKFIGQEGLLNFLFRPVSDFGASVKAGVLMPGECITINEFLEPYLPVLFRVGIDLSFSY